MIYNTLCTFKVTSSQRERDRQEALGVNWEYIWFEQIIIITPLPARYCCRWVLAHNAHSQCCFCVCWCWIHELLTKTHHSPPAPYSGLTKRQNRNSHHPEHRIPPSKNKRQVSTLHNGPSPLRTHAKPIAVRFVVLIWINTNSNGWLTGHERVPQLWQQRPCSEACFLASSLHNSNNNKPSFCGTYTYL